MKLSNIINLNSPEVILYKYIILGLLIFFLFKLLKSLVPIAINNREIRRFLYKAIPLLEIKVWIFFAIITTLKFQKDFPIFAYTIFFVLIIAIIYWAWFSLKDYIAGLIFRAKGEFYRGETLLFRDMQGIIRDFGLQTIEIETPSGKTILIPYSDLISDIYGKTEQGETTISHVFTIKLDKTIPVPETIEDIRTFILQLPWSSLQRMPHIRVSREYETYYMIEIVVYAIERDYFFTIEDAIKTHLKSKISKFQKFGYIK